MQLTVENKNEIDAKSYKQLLAGIRFSPSGSPWFQGETGEYWYKRMREMREAPGGNEMHTRVSKELGW